MTESSLSNRSPQLEDTWNAWMSRNTEEDKAQFRKLAQMAGIVLMIGMACLVIWAWTQHSDKRNDVRISMNN